MNTETVVYVGEKPVKIYMQHGFYNFHKTASAFHRHLYPELHIVAEGGQRYLAGNRHIVLKAGDLLLVPGNTFHFCIQSEKNTLHTAFQLEGLEGTDEIRQAHLSPNLILEVFSAISVLKPGEMTDRVKAFLSLFCASVTDAPARKTKPICDRGFLIDEFFSQNYASETALCRLASELHLSKKQTERVVMQYTGRSFRREIAARRIEAAKLLMGESELSLSEIGKRVGYRTYNGFWKAMKKHR